MLSETLREPWIFHWFAALILYADYFSASVWQPETKPSFTSQCNFECNCQQNSFVPVCDSNQNLYFTPCYAGCSTVVSRSEQVCVIRIYHECEGRIEKSAPRIAVWHHEACRVMSNCDPEGRIFLSYPHTNNGFFFLLTTVFIFLFI